MMRSPTTLDGATGISFLLLLLLLAATRAAADTLPALVTQFEPCALICYNAAAVDGGCSPGNFGCVCTNPGSFVVKMSICVGKACDGSKPFDSGNLMSSICDKYESKPPASDIAAASKAVISEYSSVAATATSNPVPKSSNRAASPPGGARTAGAAVGLAGVAAMAALVL